MTTRISRPRPAIPDDPLGLAPALADLATERARLWRLIDANERGYRRNDARLRDELARIDGELAGLWEARRLQNAGDAALNRAARERRGA